MKIGDQDGHGVYGVVDEDADGLLCHECGRRFVHLGLHAWKGHGVTAADYRQARPRSGRARLAATVMLLPCVWAAQVVDLHGRVAGQTRPET